MRPSIGMIRNDERWSGCAANSPRPDFPCSSISPKAYCSSMCENSLRASARVIQPFSRSGNSASDAASSDCVSARSRGRSDGTAAFEETRDKIFRQSAQVTAPLLDSMKAVIPGAPRSGERGRRTNADAGRCQNESLVPGPAHATRATADARRSRAMSPMRHDTG